jgi:pimeloyl-ACP methyl ester carboxylesterase
MTFFSVEYPGYGIYEGICTSDEVIKDAHAVIKHVIGRTGVEKIIVIGRSIGSGMAVDIASKYSKLLALLLISPFTSLRDVVKESAGDFLS